MRNRMRRAVKSRCRRRGLHEAPAWPRTPRLRGETAAARRTSSRCWPSRGLPASTRGWLTDLARRTRGARRSGRGGRRRLPQRPRARPRHLRGDRLCRLPDRAAPAGGSAGGAEGRAAHRRRRAAPGDRRNARHVPPRRSATSPRCASGSLSPTSGPRRASSTAASRRCSRLFVEREPERALALARGDVAAPARAARPAGLRAGGARERRRREAIEEARRLQASIGLHDRRIDALL